MWNVRQPLAHGAPRRGLCASALVAAVLIGATASAQDPPAAEPQDSASAPASEPDAAAPAADGADRLPRQPPTGNGVRFYRGNGPAAGQNGFYVNLWTFTPVLIVFALWLRACQWIGEDASSLQVRPVYWNSMIVGIGSVGILLGLITWNVFFGYVLMLACCGTPFGLYVRERNERVPDNAKVFTPAHLRNVGIRALARVGINVGSEEVVEQAIGPPITFMGKSGDRDGADRARQAQSSRGYMAARELVYDCIQRRGTDIHLEPREDEFSVRIRIDGVMYSVDPYDRATGESLLNIFKVLGAMDITERRRPQDGSFRAALEGREIDFRVATQGVRHGEKMSLRILDQANSVSNIAGLGLRKPVREKLEGIVHSPHGLFLVAGPTGAGKSTTLYAALNAIDATQRNIITVEDPVEYKINDVNQIEINTKSGQTFANSLRSILRQDPDVVMIGEIRDAETGEIACQAANTGHMVFSTVHANDTFTALYRMMELGVEPYMVANSLSGIMGQRLARRLAPECREAYQPNTKLLEKLGLPAHKIDVLYRAPGDPSGCPNEIPFKGRIGVFEFLEITEPMRDLIRDKASISRIKELARQNGMLYMKEEGLRLALRGVTSMEEIARVVK